MTYTRIAQLRTAEQFAGHIHTLGIPLEFEPETQCAPESPLAQPLDLPTFRIGNRFCVQPMEGWDGEPDGKPGPLTHRRWQRFGSSGAKLIWGGEATAVLPEGRANPHQLVINAANLSALAALRQDLVEAHAKRWSRDDLYTGLQLTHSGRFCRPHDQQRLEPHILYPHPLLNRKFHLPDDYPLLSDDQIETIIDAYVQAAVLAYQAGFHFVDVKHCHGYLGHEFLTAVDRPGRFGGSFENRTRFLRQVVDGIRAAAPGLEIGVRLSAFDFIPFQPGPGGSGVPDSWPGAYPYAFGGDGSGTGIDLAGPDRFLDLLETLGVRLVNLTAGSPYYCPHVQRPALFPPSDGYQSPEDPLVGVARLVEVTARLKRRHPGLVIVGSGYSYLQEWLPRVAQHTLRSGQADFIGLGRALLAYPQLPADVLAGRPLPRKHICRTFSDCTTAPRQGLVSGCYPLDEFYTRRPEAGLLKQAKSEARR
ncbi:MAG: NADH:flavin oxidoreductase [Chloroflexi bacterium]|nr:NADH:flavin oxidoreductase [Chloroflexota bacterium]